MTRIPEKLKNWLLGKVFNISEDFKVFIETQMWYLGIKSRKEWPSSMCTTESPLHFSSCPLYHMQNLPGLPLRLYVFCLFISQEKITRQVWVGSRVNFINEKYFFINFENLFLHKNNSQLPTHCHKQCLPWDNADARIFQIWAELSMMDYDCREPQLHRMRIWTKRTRTQIINK